MRFRSERRARNRGAADRIELVDESRKRLRHHRIGVERHASAPQLFGREQCAPWSPERRIQPVPILSLRQDSSDARSEIGDGHLRVAGHFVGAIEKPAGARSRFVQRALIPFVCRPTVAFARDDTLNIAGWKNELLVVRPSGRAHGGRGQRLKLKGSRRVVIAVRDERSDRERGARSDGN